VFECQTTIVNRELGSWNAVHVEPLKCSAKNVAALADRPLERLPVDVIDGPFPRRPSPA
jgi:hypothetical protein